MHIECSSSAWPRGLRRKVWMEVFAAKKAARSNPRGRAADLCLFLFIIVYVTCITYFVT